MNPTTENTKTTKTTYRYRIQAIRPCDAGADWPEGSGSRTLRNAEKLASRLRHKGATVRIIDTETGCVAHPSPSPITFDVYECANCGEQWGEDERPEGDDHNGVIRGPEGEHLGDAECGPIKLLPPVKSATGWAIAYAEAAIAGATAPPKKPEPGGLEMTCMECGKNFRCEFSFDVDCPKCGSVDIDMAM
jgi:DNA-directed RNA polymerase subunit RPC12/RpoP